MRTNGQAGRKGVNTGRNGSCREKLLAKIARLAEGWVEFVDFAAGDSPAGCIGPMNEWMGFANSPIDRNRAPVRLGVSMMRQRISRQ